MPVRWDPLAVARSMDEVEDLLAQARPFLARARERCEQTMRLPYLAGYMQDRIGRLKLELTRAMETPTRDVQTVRRDLPQKQLQQLQAQPQAPQLPGMS